jgi:hypothetical protein
MYSVKTRTKISWFTCALVIVPLLATVPRTSYGQACQISSVHRCLKEGTRCSPVEVAVGAEGKCKTLGPRGEATYAGDPPTNRAHTNLIANSPIEIIDGRFSRLDGVIHGSAVGAVAICVGIDFGAISSVTILPHHAARSMI